MNGESCDPSLERSRNPNSLKRASFLLSFSHRAQTPNLIALLSIGKVRRYTYIRIYDIRVTLSGDGVFYICHNNPGHLCGKIRVAAGKKMARQVVCLPPLTSSPQPLQFLIPSAGLIQQQQQLQRLLHLCHASIPDTLQVHAQHELLKQPFPDLFNLGSGGRGNWGGVNEISCTHMWDFWKEGEGRCKQTRNGFFFLNRGGGGAK